MTILSIKSGLRGWGSLGLCLLTIVALTDSDRQSVVCQTSEQARARIEEKGDTIRVWKERRHTGGPVELGTLLRDGDEVTVSGTAKLSWLSRGTISFRDPKGLALFDIGLPAGAEGLMRFAPIFLRQLSGELEIEIPTRQRTDPEFEIATHNVVVATYGAKFTIALNDRGRATIVRIQEGEVDLIPTNRQLKPTTIHANQEIEVNNVALIYNASRSTSIGGQSSYGDSFFIFVLELYNYPELYIGLETSLHDRTKCSFGGGGHCLPDDRVVYQKLMGPFGSQQAAELAACQNITGRKLFADSVWKGNWRNSKTWYGLMDESVSLACLKK